MVLPWPGESACNAPQKAAASSELHPPTTVSGSTFGYVTGNPLIPYRAVFWPGYATPYNGYSGGYGGGYTSGYSSGSYYPRPIVSINASGGGAHHAWDFHWNF